jgi:hypothetical protein
MSNKSVFELNLGSDLTQKWHWDNGEGGNADLTGYSIEVFKPDAAIEPYITATITDAATGEITLRVEYADTFRVGQKMKFRLRISMGSEQQSTNELGVIYK